MKHGLASKGVQLAVTKAQCDKAMVFLSKTAGIVYDNLYVVYGRRKQNDMVYNEYGGIDNEHDGKWRCRVSEDMLIRLLSGWDAIPFECYAYLNDTLGTQEAFVQARLFKTNSTHKPNTYLIDNTNIRFENAIRVYILTICSMFQLKCEYRLELFSMRDTMLGFSKTNAIHPARDSNGKIFRFLGAAPMCDLNEWYQGFKGAADVVRP